MPAGLVSAAHGPAAGTASHRLRWWAAFSLLDAAVYSAGPAVSPRQARVQQRSATRSRAVSSSAVRAGDGSRTQGSPRAGGPTEGPYDQHGGAPQSLLQNDGSAPLRTEVVLATLTIVPPAARCLRAWYCNLVLVHRLLSANTQARALRFNLSLPPQLRSWPDSPDCTRARRT